MLEEIIIWGQLQTFMSQWLWDLETYTPMAMTHEDKEFLGQVH